MKRNTAISGIIIMLAIFMGTAWAGLAVPVSPGGGTEVTDQNCPTFSWSAADGASSYKIEVYEVTGEITGRDAMSGMGNPVVGKEITAPALSWTPSSGACLSRGTKYIWYVIGVDAKGKGQWSAGLRFEVEAEALSVEQKEEVQDMLREYLAADGALPAAGNPGSTSGGLTESAAVRTSTGIIPMGYEDATNTAYGTNAGDSISSGTDNTMVGKDAGTGLTTGFRNSFYGSNAGSNTNTGYDNSFFGWNAGYSNTIGTNNSYFGYGAGFNNSGYSNSFFGTAAGYYSTGNGNVFLGYNAGKYELGSNKLYIDNCYTGGNCDEPLIYGEFNNRLIKIDGRLEVVTVATPSDIRYKKAIHNLESSLEKVQQLQGVTYEWDMDKVKGAGFKAGRQIGLIAQEVEKVLPELVYTDRDGYKTLSYDKLGPVLVEAIKEMQNEIREKESRIEKIEKAIETIQRRMVSLENPAKTVALK